MPVRYAIEMSTAAFALPMIGAICFLPVRLYRPVVNTPPCSRHVRQTVSKQNRRDGRHIPVGTGDIPRPVRLVTPLPDKIETALSPCRLEPPIRNTTRQNYRSLSPDWS